MEEVDAKAASIKLVGDVMGQLRASEISRDRVEDARMMLKQGQEIEARFTGVDRKTRIVTLSIKAREAQEEAQAVQSYKAEGGRTATTTTLGDLLKEQMSDDTDAEPGEN